jgi:hypothetical protein
VTTTRALCSAVLALVLAMAGCGGEEKKPTEEAPKGPIVKLDIQGAIPRTITIERDGTLNDVLKGTPSNGKLTPEDMKAVNDAGAKIDWAKMPLEFKTADGKPVKDGRSYTLTWGGTKPARTVTSMDGATEDPAFAKFRDQVEILANKFVK